MLAFNPLKCKQLQFKLTFRLHILPIIVGTNVMTGLLVYLTIAVILWWWLLGRNRQCEQQLEQQGITSVAQIIAKPGFSGRDQKQVFSILLYRFTTAEAKRYYGMLLSWSASDQLPNKQDTVPIIYSKKQPFLYNQLQLSKKPSGIKTPRSLL
ncbi:MAG: hypothetical protein ACI845_004230 [Gammaproteobacteria bacterium]|jgi:hypothetical protein